MLRATQVAFSVRTVIDELEIAAALVAEEGGGTRVIAAGRAVRLST